MGQRTKTWSFTIRWNFRKHCGRDNGEFNILFVALTSVAYVLSFKFWEGVAEGPATVRRSDGTFEEFQYNMVCKKKCTYVKPR